MRPRGRAASGLPLALWLAGTCLALLAGRAASQGLRAEARLGASIGITRNLVQLSNVQAEANKKWGQKAWQSLQTSCGSRSAGTRASASVCGADLSSDSGKLELLYATSPSVFDTRNPDHNGGFVSAPAPRTQYDCSACVAMAIAAAADAAVSKATGMSLTEPLVSARQLFFCSYADPKDAPDCSNGWELYTGLNELTKGGIIPLDRCLPFYKADRLGTMTDDVICQPTCDDIVEGGKFVYTKRVPLDSFVRIQEHIRRYGGAVTRMWIPNGFMKFYQDPKNKDVVWTKDSKNATIGFNHAVVLIGYNNPGGYWLVWSSWGKDWGDNGVVKVKYGILDIGDPGNTYGVMFIPTSQSTVDQSFGELSNDAKLPKGCQWYNVKRTTFLSKVAYDLGIPLEKLVQDNAATVSDLKAWIKAGSRLKACDAVPRPPSIASPPTRRSPAVGAGVYDARGNSQGGRQRLGTVASPPRAQISAPRTPQPRTGGSMDYTPGIRYEPVRRPIVAPTRGSFGGRTSDSDGSSSSSGSSTDSGTGGGGGAGTSSDSGGGGSVSSLSLGGVDTGMMVGGGSGGVADPGVASGAGVSGGITPVSVDAGMVVAADTSSSSGGGGGADAGGGSDGGGTGGAGDAGGGGGDGDFGR